MADQNNTPLNIHIHVTLKHTVMRIIKTRSYITLQGSVSMFNDSSSPDFL